MVRAENIKTKFEKIGPVDKSIRTKIYLELHLVSSFKK